MLSEGFCVVIVITDGILFWSQKSTHNKNTITINRLPRRYTSRNAASAGMVYFTIFTFIANTNNAQTEYLS
ncbi:MAG: hypothetical protein Tsb0033_24350 [Winogradskyella sp.]